MTIAALLPILIPFAAGLLLLGRRTNAGYQKGISAVAGVGTALASINLLFTVATEGVVVVLMGDWPAPFGIVFAADRLSAIMVCLASTVTLSCLLFAFAEITAERMKGAFYALFQFILFGINGSFLTGDLFNLFVFFEVVLMASYVLLTLGNEHRQAASGLTYLSINLIGSTLFLTGAGLLYGQIGTLNMAQIAVRASEAANPGLVTAAAVIFLFVFGLKSAMFPVNAWLPDAYTAPPTAVSALFAGLMTKVGVYAMFRVFGTVFAHDVAFTHTGILIPLAGLTMLLGVWGAMVQVDIPRILAFHSISQVGYILMGLALFSPLALAGGIFHMIHHSVVKSSLFLIGGGVGYAAGSQHLKKISGLIKSLPIFAVLFGISAMALAGIPPFSGFFSKLALVTSGLAQNHPVLVTSALATSLFTLYSMVKIWRLGFWGELKRPNENTLGPEARPRLLTACLVSVGLVVALTAFAGPIMRACALAGESILNQDRYITAVLTHRPERSGGETTP